LEALVGVVMSGAMGAEQEWRGWEKHDHRTSNVLKGIEGGVMDNAEAVVMASRALHNLGVLASAWMEVNDPAAWALAKPRLVAPEPARDSEGLFIKSPLVQKKSEDERQDKGTEVGPSGETEVDRGEGPSGLRGEEMEVDCEEGPEEAGPSGSA